MKVLFINNHHKMDGGAERYYFDLSHLLTSKGHKIAYFSMSDPDNKKTKWEKYFVDNIDLERGGIKNLFTKLSRIIYSLEAKKKIKKVLGDFNPDVVHINNIYFYISPSILGEIKKRKIPIVQTVHDYQLISPNINLYFNSDIYEIPKRYNYYRARFTKDTKGSHAATFITAVASYIQHLFRLYERNVDIFITPSNFVKKKLEEYGFHNNIVTLSNYVNPIIGIKESPSKNYVLFFGRISEHKGVLKLLRLARECPEIHIKIIGKYANRYMESRINNYLENSSSNLEVVEYQNKHSLVNYIKDSNFVVVPSMWFETQSYSVMESFACGKTVVASRIGGIPEFVQDGKTGYLFNPKNYNEFKKNVLFLWNNNQMAIKMGKAAQKYVTEKHNPENYYQKIMEIYKTVMKT